MIGKDINNKSVEFNIEDIRFVSKPIYELLLKEYNNANTRDNRE